MSFTIFLKSRSTQDIQSLLKYTISATNIDKFIEATQISIFIFN